ncbi:hypothetical protein LDENG_00067460 [Lucifuga dentata]|nr:hypothetical protein LDENG_00067460 [Lucifuga dentata]
MEESGETAGSESNGAAEWLCPLCQKGQPDRSSLSVHLTDQHSVLPSCVNRLLDIAVIKRRTSGENLDKGAQKSSDAVSCQLKHSEDSSSEPCQSSETSDTTQTLGDKVMEEDRIMEQEGGEAEPEPEQEGNQHPGAKQQNATENKEIPDANEKSTAKNGGPAENNARPFKCNACLETFSTRTALSVHYNSDSHIQRMTTGAAKQGGENEAQSPPVPVLSRPYVSNKPYQCAVCRVSYNHAITLESHMKSVLHQTRSRYAGNAANSAVTTSVGGSTTTVPNTAVNTSVAGGAAVVSQIVSTTNCAAPGTLMVTTAKDGEQIQTSAVAPSLLASPVASAQAVSAFLTLLTSNPGSISHSLLPSLFASAAAPGAAMPQLVPQPQMVMPLILNRLQDQTQQHLENQQGQLLTQCVPLVGLSTTQQALLAQRLNTLQNQWPSMGIPANTQACLEEQKQTVKCEGGQDRQTVEEKSSVQNKDRGNCTIESVKTEKDHEQANKEFAQGPNIESKVKVENNEDSGKAHRDSTTDGDSSTDQLDLEGDKATSLNLSPTGTEKSLRNSNLSPSASVPSNSSLSPVHLNLTLSPDSTPQKSQSGTSPCGSLGTPKSSPSTNALTHPSRAQTHCNMVGCVTSPELPMLSEFQSEVLWAFFESRSEADAASPLHEDCEALGREVGLSEEQVRRWLSQARLAKQRQRATGLENLHGFAGFTKHVGGFDNDYDEEESSLVIAEGEDDTEASGSQAIDLSNTKGKRRWRSLGKEGQGDSCLTSDSENEVYTSVIVSDEESQNGSMKEGFESPSKDDARREVSGDKGSGGGKVLRSTTVFLSDAEDEYEDEEGGAGLRAKRKWKGDFEREEVDVKKERHDSDVDLELEAQGDPPSSQSHAIDHSEMSTSAVHSLPLSIAPFSTQFLAPYILSLNPSLVGDGRKLPVFSNPPTITRLSDSLLSQSLSPHSQTSHYLSNGDDCESALDLSMGKNSNSKSSSSSSLADKMSAQKGQLLDGLGLRPTTRGLVVVQVKPDSVTAMPSSNSSTSLVNCNNMSKSSIYMRAAEKMNATLLEREREKEREKEKEREREQDQQQRKSKGKRYRDMRRSRTIIQAEQLDILYGCYFKDPNPGKHEFEQISEWVHLPKKVVQIWFQNMRARERKGEVRFISDGTLAAVGKPLIKFTWPLSKPIFSNKPAANNTGSITAAPIVRTLIKTEREPVKEVSKAAVVKKVTPVPIKPKEVSSTAVSPVSSSASAVPKTKLETTSNVTMVKVAPKVHNPILLPPPKDSIPVTPHLSLKRKPAEDSEEEKTDEERDNEDEVGPGPGTTNRMVPKLPTTPINNRPPATTVVPQKQNGLKYWSPKIPIKINTLSREQLALPTHTPPRTIPPPPTPSIAPVSPNTPSSAKVSSPTTPATGKSSPTESSFLPHSSSRRPRTHLSCLQLSILQSCYETCAHPNAVECEAIGSELNLPLKVVQIWFQNTRAKEKRWRLQQEKMSPLPGGKVDISSGSYLQYNALKANRPILPKPVQLTIIEPAAPPIAGQPVPKETLKGHCDACNVSFESRAAARAHVFSQHHLATLRTTNFGQPTTLVSKNGNGSSGSGSVAPGSQVSHSTTVTSSGVEIIIESSPPMAASSS